MGLLASYFGTVQAGRPADGDDFWYRPLSLQAVGAKLLAEEDALALDAVWACVQVRGQTLASLPLFIYERMPDGSKEPAINHPQWEVLHDTPNDWMSSFDWREMMQGHHDLRGNAYSQIVPGRRGAVDQLIPLRADRMSIERLVNDRLRYVYRLPEGGTKRFAQEEIFHVRGFTLDGINGLSPIAVNRETVELGLATQRYGTRFFANNAQPSGMLTTDQVLGDEAVERLRKDWNAVHMGVEHSHRLAIGEQGLKYHPIGISNEDAQFLETRGYTAVGVARIFRVPPHKIGILDRATFSNIESQNIEFVTDTMLSVVRRWESAINTQLITDRRRFFAEFKLDGLLRGDIESRYKAYRIGRDIGVLNPNEIRLLENMNKRTDPGGDEYVVPLNMGSSSGRRGGDPKERAIGRGGAVASLPPAQFSTSLIDDAVERIVNREERDLAARLPKTDGDPERFQQWLAAYFDGEIPQIVKVLTPIVATVENASGVEIGDVESLAGAIAEAGHDSMSQALTDTATTDGLIETWAITRREDIRRTLQLTFIEEALAHVEQN